MNYTSKPETEHPGRSDIVFHGLVVSAVTFHERRVLLLRRSLAEEFLPGKWVLPAGKVQEGERPEDAVLRELAEEAGLKGSAAEYIGASRFDSTYKGVHGSWEQLNYRVLAARPDVRYVDGSHIDHLWVPVEEMCDPPVVLDEFTRGVLAQVLPSVPDRRTSAPA